MIIPNSRPPATFQRLHDLPMTQLPRIFVNIASYRDSECQWTVKDIFDKAKHPERIFVGICWQYDEDEDQHCFAVPYPRPENVREVRYDWREALGVCWARYQAQRLLQDEEYVLQIDSHSRFIDDWDERMLEELALCDSPKPILSCYVAWYKPPVVIEKDKAASILRPNFFDHWGNIRLTGSQIQRIPPAPLKAMFISGHFMFSSADAIRETPYDPYLYFDQEEMTYSLRLFTHGWDIFSTRSQMLYHFYVTSDNKPRPMHWEDMNNRKQDTKHGFLRDRGIKRMDHITGHKISNDPEIIRELDKFGLGTARSLQDFEYVTGIDFKRKILSEYASRAWYIPNIGTYNETKIYVPELDDADKTPPASHATADDPIYEPGRIKDHKRIFVAIAAFRDAECQWTVKDLFDKANNPDRVYIGICMQYEREKDQHLFGVPYPRPDQVRVRHYHPNQSNGMNWARHEALQCWVGEEYILSIDSHMRFEQGWDDILLEMLERCPSPKSGISAFLPNYQPPANLEKYEGQQTRIRLNHLDHQHSPSLIHLGGMFIDAKGPLGVLVPTAFVVGNFLFGPRRMFQDVPIDPHIYFFGDEITLSSRLWTHGWNIYQPDVYVAYHLWVTGQPEGTQKETPAYKRNDHPRNIQTLSRVKHVMGLELAENPEVLKEIDRYGHGEARTLDSFWDFAGINAEKWEPTERAHRGEWYLAPPSAVAPVVKATPRALETTRPPQPTSMNIHMQVAKAKLVNVGPKAGGLIVYDNFLSEDMVDKLHHYCLGAEYAPAFPPLRGHDIVLEREAVPLLSLTRVGYAHGKAAIEHGTTRYPSRTVLDAVVDYILATLPKIHNIVGSAGIDWDNFDVCPWLVPSGGGFEFGRIFSKNASGIFISFLTHNWPWQNGGLLLADDNAEESWGSGFKEKNMLLKNTSPVENLNSKGLARCIMPQGGRAVFLANRTTPVLTKILLPTDIPFLLLAGQFKKG